MLQVKGSRKSAQASGVLQSVSDEVCFKRRTRRSVEGSLSSSKSTSASSKSARSRKRRKKRSHRQSRSHPLRLCDPCPLQSDSQSAIPLVRRGSLVRYDGLPFCSTVPGGSCSPSFQSPQRGQHHRVQVAGRGGRR